MKNDFLSHADAAQRNRNNILHYVKAHQPISRTDIWEAMDISRASVTQIIRQLQENGLIVETGEGESTGGRKPRHLMLRSAAKKYYAFDWLTHTLCLMDLSGNMIREVGMQLPLGVTPEFFAEAILKEIQHMEAAGLCACEEAAGLVLSLPGLVDIRGGTAHSCTL
jgi:biotin operon repressor